MQKRVLRGPVLPQLSFSNTQQIPERNLRWILLKTFADRIPRAGELSVLNL